MELCSERLQNYTAQRHPITGDDAKIALLINLFDRRLVPFREELFKKKYEKVNKVGSFFFGWFFPIWSTKYPFRIWSAIVYGPLLLWLYQLVKANPDVQFPDAKKLPSVPATNWPMKILLKSFPDFMVKHFHLARVKAVALSESHPLIIGAGMFTISKIVKLAGLSRLPLKQTDMKKLSMDLQDYISFHEFSQKDLVSNGVYPSTTTHMVTSEYNVDQIQLWICMTLGRLNDDKSNRLEIAETQEAAEVFGDIKGFVIQILSLVLESSLALDILLHFPLMNSSSIPWGPWARGRPRG